MLLDRFGRRQISAPGRRETASSCHRRRWKIVFRAVLQGVEPWLNRWSSARGRVQVWLLERARLLPHLNLTVTIQVGGQHFRVPVREGTRLSTSDVEPWMDRVLGRLIALRSGCFVDVGVNLGQTLLKLKAAGPEITYIGFEPNPRCYCYVKDVVALNQLQRCTIYPFALGEKPAVVQLFQSSAADPSASLVEGFRPEDHYSSRQFATVFPGDMVLADSDHQEISIIKIDVEGAERDVLKGLTQTIERHRPFIICEVLPVYDQTSANGQFRLARQKEIEIFLRERRYSIQRVDANGGLTSIAEFGVHSDLSSCNYVLAPLERAV